MICGYCGKEIEYGTRFCPVCGRKQHTVDAVRGPLWARDGSRGFPWAFMLALLATMAALAGLWYYQPWKRLTPPLPEPDKEEVTAPVMPGAPGANVDALIAGKTGGAAAASPLTPEQRAHEAGSVEDVLEKLWKAERAARYHDVYSHFSQGLKNRLKAYYPDVRISNPADYVQWRQAGAFEPEITAIGPLTDLDVSSRRATAFADASVIHMGKEKNWEFLYILTKTDTGQWRVDGLAAGPDGPARETVAADMDEDGRQETIEFTGDPLHRALRWEVLTPDGSQAYVFEMQACEAAPGSSPKSNPYTRVASDPVTLMPFGLGERQALAEQFPVWAKAAEADYAMQNHRKGFLMHDGCVENPSYFVFWFKDGYRELVF